jgi:hypothetical protein
MKIKLLVISVVTSTIGLAQNNINPTGATGDVGINMVNPFDTPDSPIHVVGGGTFSQTGWQQAITISNNGALAFSNQGTTGNSTFFMGAPSNSPVGDFYFGTVPSTIGGAGNGPVVYAYSILGQNTSPGLNQAGSREKATTIFRTNTFLNTGDGIDAYLGINTLEAKRVLDVHSKGSQLRLTNTENNNLNLGIFTDFDVQTFGLNIKPMQEGIQRTVFVHRGNTALTLVALNVNGNRRFRYVPEESANSLILGKENNGDADDLTFRRLEFTGNTTDVLLGNGTWGPATPNITANNGLSIDATGEIVQLGQTIPATGVTYGGSAQLLHDTEVPLKGYNLHFTGLGDAANNVVSIGQPNPDNVTRKLYTYATDQEIGITGRVNATNLAATVTDIYGVEGIIENYPSIGDNAVGVSGMALNPIDGSATGIGTRGIARGNNYNIGVRGQISDVNAEYNVGLDSRVTGGEKVFGVKVSTQGDAGTGFGAGIQAIANFSDAANVYGGQFAATNGSTTGSTYGVYATAYNGVNPAATYAGYFNGNVFISGSYGPSDINMKTNINDYDSSLYVINLLEPKTFEYTNANFQGMNLATGHQYGLIAQEVEQILPALVSNNVHPAQYDTLGNQIHPAYDFKGVDYTSLIPVLLGGIKEQQALISNQDSLITDLNDRLTNLENCLSNILPLLCAMNNSMIQTNTTETQSQLKTFLNVELNDGESIILEQNVPNPFAEQTTISYTIPESVEKAQIHFYNQSGKLINTIDITERGTGQVNVFASDLSSGIYTYTLVADGQVVATKRMVKTN